jgi:hypothetical protein
MRAFALDDRGLKSTFGGHDQEFPVGNVVRHGTRASPCSARRADRRGVGGPCIIVRRREKPAIRSDGSGRRQTALPRRDWTAGGVSCCAASACSQVPTAYSQNKPARKKSGRPFRDV